MNNKLALYAKHFDRNTVQLLIVILSLAMLVLGIGAPSDGGGAG